MSYGIIRVQKFKATAVKAIQFHNRREKKSRTNPDIDEARTQKNVALVDCPDYRAAIADRLSTLKTTRAVRKDAVVMAQILVTSGPEFFEGMTPGKQREFFQQSLEFIADRYGQENILSAVIHMDEKTPHMHVDLTPIRDGRLTAKTIFTRAEFSKLHTDFAREVGQKWCLKRGESREEKQRHLSSEEYKLKARREALEEEREHLAFPQRLSGEDVEPQKLGLLKKEEPAAVAARLNEKLAPLWAARAHVHLLQTQVRELKEQVEHLKADRDDMRRHVKNYQKFFSVGLTSDQLRALLDMADSYRKENRKQAEKKAQEEREEREKRPSENQQEKKRMRMR